MKRIVSLESVRGLLALWVVVGHTLKHCGVNEKLLGPFAVLMHAGLAVDVFIILSGFVIFNLLDNQRGTYPQFLVGRWFRLAPLFLAAVAVGALTLDWQMAVIASSPFPAPAISTDIRLHQTAIDQLGAHVASHLTMLHGLIPDSLLPEAAYTIIGQAWSISVEWQFYLVAPLLFALVAGKRWHLLCAVILAICALRASNVGTPAFAIKHAGFFIVGIVSYYGWKHSQLLKGSACLVDALAVTLIATAYFFVVRNLSLAVWIVLMATIVSERRGTWTFFTRTIAAFLHLRPLQWLGKISYSVYLVHMLVFYAAQHLVLMLYPQLALGSYTALMLLLVVSATVVVSALTFHAIESPGIALGKRVARRMFGGALTHAKDHGKQASAIPGGQT